MVSQSQSRRRTIVTSAARVPEHEKACPRCGACVNCGLLEKESATLNAPHAFCPNCGAGLRRARPVPGMTLLLWRILWGLTIGVLTLTAGAAALCGTCAMIFMGSGTFAAVPFLLGAVIVFGISFGSIMALKSKRP